MTDIEKALAMIAPSAFYEINPENFSILAKAFKAAIEQHEAFQQEVSDECIVLGFKPALIGIGRFIIPAPKSDPLVEVMKQLGWYNEKSTADFRASLDARGFEIREKNDV